MENRWKIDQWVGAQGAGGGLSSLSADIGDRPGCDGSEDGDFVEEEPAGIAGAVVPVGALFGGVDGYAYVAGGCRCAEFFLDADEFHFRMAVFGEFVARKSGPVDAVVADGVSDGFGLENP